MTGSGETGLCIGLLEEAIMDNIPAIVVDPKGDISELGVKSDATRIALEPEPIKPYKKDIDVRAVSLLWLAYNDDGQPVW